MTKVFKDLDNLKWNHHINYINKNFSITSFQVLKSLKTSDITTLRRLYMVYVRPKIE